MWQKYGQIQRVIHKCLLCISKCKRFFKIRCHAPSAQLVISTDCTYLIVDVYDWSSAGCVVPISQ